jgi:hypothetical protein
MTPKTRDGGMKVVKKVKTYKEYAEKLVSMLSSKRGTLLDWESDMGDRIYYTDSKYPGYEIIIRTWSIRFLDHSPDTYFVDSYSIYAQPVETGTPALDALNVA